MDFCIYVTKFKPVDLSIRVPALLTSRSQPSQIFESDVKKSSPSHQQDEFGSLAIRRQFSMGMANCTQCATNKQTFRSESWWLNCRWTHFHKILNVRLSHLKFWTFISQLFDWTQLVKFTTSKMYHRLLYMWIDSDVYPEDAGVLPCPRAAPGHPPRPDGAHRPAEICCQSSMIVHSLDGAGKLTRSF